MTAFLTTLLCIFHLQPGRVQSLPTVPFIISFIIFLVGLVTAHHQVRIFLLVFFSISQEGATPAFTTIRDFLAVLSSEQPQLGVATSTQYSTGDISAFIPPGSLRPLSGQPRDHHLTLNSHTTVVLAFGVALAALRAAAGVAASALEIFWEYSSVVA
jgi:hypothetical protein